MPRQSFNPTYRVLNYYEKSDKIDEDMTWEVAIGIERVCLCYSEATAQKIANALNGTFPPND